MYLVMFWIFSGLIADQYVGSLSLIYLHSGPRHWGDPCPNQRIPDTQSHKPLFQVEGFKLRVYEVSFRLIRQTLTYDTFNFDSICITTCMFVAMPIAPCTFDDLSKYHLNQSLLDP